MTLHPGLEAVAMTTKPVQITYPVNDIYASVQGEGVLTGVPMVILRLQGCDVGCPWCDTKQTWGLESPVETLDAALGDSPKFAHKPAYEIGRFIQSRWPQLTWILLTGGEPAKYELKQLVSHLHCMGYKVAIETSGTEVGHLSAGIDWVCVSPKVNMPGGKEILPLAMASAHEIKYPVGRKSDIDTLESLLAEHPHRPNVIVCIQPISQSEKATELCLKTSREKNWRLSIQMHKYIGEP